MKYAKIVLPHPFICVKTVFLPAIIILASPFLCHYLDNLLPYEILLPYFERFSWASELFVVRLTSVSTDIIATALCLCASFRLFHGRKKSLNRTLYVFSLYCVVYHCFLSLFRMIFVISICESIPAYLIADLAAIPICIACIWMGRRAFPSTVHYHRILSLPRLITAALFIAAVVAHIAVCFSSLEYFKIHGFSYMPDPIQLISETFSFLTQAALKKFVYPNYLSSIRGFYTFIFIYWVLAFFGALVFTCGNERKAALRNQMKGNGRGEDTENGAVKNSPKHNSEPLPRDSLLCYCSFSVKKPPAMPVRVEIFRYKDSSFC